MYPEIKWLLISGSPCQDLTYVGYLNGLLGLTGKRSMLFFVVYVVLCHTQKLFGFNSVRYLAENAGSMQAVQGDRNLKTGHHLDHSEHFHSSFIAWAYLTRYQRSSGYGMLVLSLESGGKEYSCGVTLILVYPRPGSLQETKFGAHLSI